MRKIQLNLGMVFVLAALLAGCATYYRVNDPAGTKEYYTTDIKETKTGAISFKDEKSGSEVRQISADEFEAAVKGEKK